MKDIENFNDIKLLVDTFYNNARKDKTLGPIFDKYLADHWEEHFEKLYRFWQTVILKEMTYYGQPVPVHFSMGLHSTEFEIWVSLWQNTVSELFEGKKAERAKLRGRTMADSFMRKIKKHSQKPS